MYVCRATFANFLFILCMKNLSETIRKEPLAEAQTALGKQKIRSVERRYLPHYRNSVKNCFLTQNFTVIGQLAAELWPKTIFKTAFVRHLEFPKFSYLVTLLLPSFKFAYVYQISSQSGDVSLRYGDFMIFKMADLRHLEFYGFNNGFFESPCWTSYRTSIETIALK